VGRAETPAVEPGTTGELTPTGARRPTTGTVIQRTKLAVLVLLYIKGPRLPFRRVHLLRLPLWTQLAQVPLKKPVTVTQDEKGPSPCMHEVHPGILSVPTVWAIRAVVCSSRFESHTTPILRAALRW